MLNERTLKSSLDSGAILPTYIIVGNDAYLKKQALDRIVNAVGVKNDEINFIPFEGNVPLQNVYDELYGFPFMADKKCVVLSDFNIDDSSSFEFENLISLASEHPDTSIFVLYYQALSFDLKKSERLKKLIAAVEKSGGTEILLDHRTHEELARQLSAAAKKQGALLTPQNASYLINTCSADIQTLLNELSKLVAFTKGAEITKDIINKISVKSVETSIYDLAAKIMAGDSNGAIKVLDDLFFMKLPVDLIVYNISSAFVDMFRAAASAEKGFKPEEFAADFKMKGREFVLSRAVENFRRYDYRKLDLSFDALLWAEGKIKSYSSNEKIVLEELIVKLIYIMKTGEALD